MEIKEGTSRIAIIGEKETIKIPNIKKLRQLVHGLTLLREHKYGILKIWLTRKTKGMDTLRSILYDGIEENLREYLTSEVLNGTVVPTHYSAHGLLNLQYTAAPALVTSNELVDLFHFADYRDEFKASHTFTNPENFGVHKERVKVIDYGEKTFFKIVMHRHAEVLRILTELTRIHKYRTEQIADVCKQEVPGNSMNGGDGHEHGQ